MVGLEVAGGVLPDARALVGRQLGLERRRDLERHVALDREDVGELAVVRLGPDVAVGLGIDQLRHHPHPVTSPPHAPLEQRPHAESLADFP